MPTLTISRQFVIPKSPPPALEFFRFLPRYGMVGQPDPLETAQKVGDAPDVIKLADGPTGVTFTSDWQWYLRAINPNLSLNQVTGIMDTLRWGFNGTGVNAPDWYHNYLKNEGKAEDPFTDKDRTFRGNVHAGVIVGNEVIFNAFDGSKPPPPLSEISPQSHPWMYCVLTIVYANGQAKEWSAVGAIEGYPKPAAIFPLIATREIRVPLSLLEPVAAWAMPY